MVAAPDGSPHVSGQYSLAAVVRLFKIAHLPLGSSGPLTASSAGVSPAHGGHLAGRLAWQRCRPPCRRYPRRANLCALSHAGL